MAIPNVNESEFRFQLGAVVFANLERGPGVVVRRERALDMGVALYLVHHITSPGGDVALWWREDTLIPWTPSSEVPTLGPASAIPVVPAPRFCFELGAEVRLMQSSEVGVVIGRAEYAHGHDSYLIRYKAGDGRQVEQWWAEDALVLVQAAPRHVVAGPEIEEVAPEQALRNIVHNLDNGSLTLLALTLETEPAKHGVVPFVFRGRVRWRGDGGWP